MRTARRTPENAFAGDPCRTQSSSRASNRSCSLFAPPVCASSSNSNPSTIVRVNLLDNHRHDALLRRQFALLLWGTLLQSQFIDDRCSTVSFLFIQLFSFPLSPPKIPCILYFFIFMQKIPPLIFDYLFCCQRYFLRFIMKEFSFLQILIFSLFHSILSCLHLIFIAFFSSSSQHVFFIVSIFLLLRLNKMT